MNNKQEFYRQLADVPAMPADIGDEVFRTIRHRSVVRVRLLSMAAVIVVAAGAGMLQFNRSFVNHPLRPEVTSELQTVREFLNGNDLESDLELYAVVEGY